MLRFVMPRGGSASSRIQKGGIAQPPENLPCCWHSSSGGFVDGVPCKPRAASGMATQVQFNILVDLPGAMAV
jgi:hypothetical protein